MSQRTKQRTKPTRIQDSGKSLHPQNSKDNQSNSIDELLVNQKFAQRYEASKRRQFLRDAPARVFEQPDEESGQFSSSSSEEEDDFAELLTKRIDRKVNETLNAIRNKDPRIYDENTKFFQHVHDHSENTNSASDANDNSDDEPVAGWDTIATAAENATRKLTLKDYVRESLLNNGRLSDDDDEQSERDQNPPQTSQENSRRQTQQEHETSESLQRRLESLADSHKKPTSNSALGDPFDTRGDDKGDDGDDEFDDGDFFVKKEKTALENEEEEREYELFMKKQSATKSKQIGEDLLLHSYLEKETPDDKERFLRDFILNNGWLDKNAGDAPAAHDYEIEIDTNGADGEARRPEDDDEFEEKVDNFEATYNFRFEDPEGAHIVSHARNVPDSMRRRDNTRKRAREARKMRKEQEKAEKAEEIKRLKNLKKKEIQARLLAIREAAGDSVDITGIDLEGDFDPDKFNEQMESKFNDEYYSAKDEQMKYATTEGMTHASEKHFPGKDSDDIPDDLKDDVKRMTEEYYDLDFEDIIDGVPMKFKYKKVEPESFSMTAEEILNTDDKELNRLVSTKYLAPYRSNRDAQKQAWKVRAALRKRKRHKSYHVTEEDVVQNNSVLSDFTKATENGDDSTPSSRKKERRKSKSDTGNMHLQNDKHAVLADGNNKNGTEQNARRLQAGSSEIAENGKPENDRNEIQEGKPSRRRKRRNKKREHGGLYDYSKISESRLKAYGITPP